MDPRNPRRTQLHLPLSIPLTATGAAGARDRTLMTEQNRQHNTNNPHLQRTYDFNNIDNNDFETHHQEEFHEEPTPELQERNTVSNQLEKMTKCSMKGAKLIEQRDEHVTELIKVVVRDSLWMRMKFLPDDLVDDFPTVYAGKSDYCVLSTIVNQTDEKKILDSRKEEMPYEDMAWFWVLYAPVVQEALGDLRTNKTKDMKKLFFKGMNLFFDCFVLSFVKSNIFLYIELQKERENFEAEPHGDDHSNTYDLLRTGNPELQNPEGGGEPPEVIKKEKRGPFHTLLHLAYMKKTHLILKTKHEDVLKAFLFNVLPFGIGKSKWNHCVKELNLKTFVSTSDEAFAMLALENNSIKWLDELINPNTKKKDLERTYYSQGNEKNKSPGWTDEGIDRFLELGELVKKVRKENVERMNKFNEWVKDKKRKRVLKGRERKSLDRIMKNGGCFHCVDNSDQDREAEERKKKRNRMLMTHFKSNEQEQGRLRLTAI